MRLKNVVVLCALLAVVTTAALAEEVDSSQENAGADSPVLQAPQDLEKPRMLLYLSLGAVLALSAVLLISLLLMLLRKCRIGEQQPADDLPPAPSKPAEGQLRLDVGSSRLSVDSHPYEPFDPMRVTLLPPLPLSPPPLIPDLLYEGSYDKSQVYQSLLDR